MSGVGGGVDPGVVDAIGSDLRSAGFTTDGVADFLGADVNAALSRGVWWPVLRVTHAAPADRQRLAVLVRLLLLVTIASRTMEPLRIVGTSNGNYSLLFLAGETPSDEAVEALGHEPNG
ncbi:DUF7059 domain-containing protein, partial [Mycolicibacterium porcinum]|uniref:DUF7059 domain-containing protein n=1 Tax=Mycolicibacterium porcinum TaxID=39693 RepID=UPI003D9B543A